ncbi:MAG: IS110 family transposase, partial [Lachnospiraceae bacterium]|nr:IS110 family transposase [Lachnospiraceae bacterium]
MDTVRKAQKLSTNADVKFVCGYEAGCLGYTLYHQLTQAGHECVIPAPSTIPSFKTGEIKTDKRDARKLAQCLAFGTYSAVYVPTSRDLAVKEYIRMRDDHKTSLKRVKQQILALCLRHGFQYRSSDSRKSYWTLAHMKYLHGITLDGCAQDALEEYLLTYTELTGKIERFDQRLEEIAATQEYQEKVKKLRCLMGIRTHTALAVIVETGDFRRFASADQYASYLGITPGEHSSGDTRRRTGITHAGNSHIRRLLVEASQGYGRGRVGYKSKALKARQAGSSTETIAYADRANERLRRRYYSLIFSGKPANVAKTAVARELACFIWGMMTDHTA